MTPKSNTTKSALGKLIGSAVAVAVGTFAGIEYQKHRQAKNGSNSPKDLKYYSRRKLGRTHGRKQRKPIAKESKTEKSNAK